MISNKKDKILIIAAHPDDEILGCGGLLSKFSNKAKIAIIFIAEGDSCRFKSSDLTVEIEKEIKYREDCSRRALKVFNLNDIEFNRLPCGRLDSIDIIDINKIIEKKILSFKPSIILSHSKYDTNNDHRIVSRSVEMSTRPVFGYDIDIYSFEVLSSSEWNYSEPFNPNFFVRLSKRDIDKKIMALKMYDGEMRSFPHSRSADGLEILAKYRGMQIGVDYAEAFYSTRIIMQ